MVRSPEWAMRARWFPGAWIVATILLCVSNASLLIAVLLSFLIACCCIVLSPVKKVLPVVVLLGGCVLVPYAYREATWNPMGQASDDGWGNVPIMWSTSYDQLPPAPSGYGDVATTRTEEGPLWASVPYFVFIHATGKPDAHDNLVFRYSGTDATPPRITWISRFAVKIAVDEPGEITLLQSYAGSISISYALGHDVR